MDSIDGEIIRSSWEIIGNYNENRGDGGEILQSNLIIYLTTSSVTYRVGIMWETANSFSKEETGIRNIGLSLDGRTLVLITATEGVGEWHN